MKKVMILKFILLFLFLVFPRRSFAQDYTQLGLPEGAIARLGKGGEVAAVTYSPDGRTLASGGSGGIHLWNAATGEHKLTLGESSVNSVVYSPDGSTLAYGDFGGIHLWNAATGEHKLTLGESSVNSVVYSPDGSTLAGSTANEILFWDAKTGEHKLTLDRPVPGISSIAYSPDGTQLAVGSKIGVWLYNLHLGTEIGLLTGHTEQVYSVTYSPDGRTLASGSKDDTIRLWDAETGKHKHTLSGHRFYVVSVVYSSDGNMLASGGTYHDRTIRLWDAETGKHKYTFSGHTDGVESIAFSPDGNTLASGSSDETILLWDITSFTNTNAIVSISPSPLQSPALGAQLTLSLNIAGGRDVTGYQATVEFDPSALRYVSRTNGDYISKGAFVVPAVVTGNTVTLAATSLTGGSNGGGKLATLTFEVIDVKASTLSISDVLLTTGTGRISRPRIQSGQITEPPSLKGDVSGDGIVNIVDLVLVASNFGETGDNISDVSGDGIVNIVDLTLVVAAMRNAAGAPTTWRHDLDIFPTIAEVQQWLHEAQQVGLMGSDFQRGVLMLEQLLASLVPEDTALLPNYPNPFNPETWIPYQLATPMEVSVSIYSADGKLIRVLKLGQQASGVYKSQGRAAYWDGRNEIGESVASGVYFYTLKAGDFTATRKMLIRK